MPSRFWDSHILRCWKQQINLEWNSNKKISFSIKKKYFFWIFLNSCHGFLVEKALVVIVNSVEIILQNVLLGDLADDLVHDSVGHVDGHWLQDEGVGSTELQVTEFPGGDLSQQNGPVTIVFY